MHPIWPVRWFQLVSVPKWDGIPLYTTSQINTKSKLHHHSHQVDFWKTKTAGDWYLTFHSMVLVQAPHLAVSHQSVELKVYEVAEPGTESNHWHSADCFLSVKFIPWDLLSSHSNFLGDSMEGLKYEWFFLAWWLLESFKFSRSWLRQLWQTPPMYLSFETLPNVRIQVSNFGGQVMEQPKNIWKMKYIIAVIAIDSCREFSQRPTERCAHLVGAWTRKARKGRQRRLALRPAVFPGGRRLVGNLPSTS